jgi:hypothetical protein
MNMNEGMIQEAVARLFNYRIYDMLPNASWGLMGLHECDMLLMDHGGRLTEIEIKIRPSDLKADFKKPHRIRPTNKIGRLIYCMPEDMVKKYGHLVPKECGIIQVFPWIGKTTRNRVAIEWVRRAKHRRDAIRLSNADREKFLRLGLMRYWSLRFHSTERYNSWPGLVNIALNS